MRTALVLIKCKGPEALDYSNRKAEVIQERGGDEEDIVFWQKISKQIELILYSDE